MRTNFHTRSHQSNWIIKRFVLGIKRFFSFQIFALFLLIALSLVNIMRWLKIYILYTKFIRELTPDGYTIVLVEGRPEFITTQMSATLMSVLPHVEKDAFHHGHNWTLRCFVPTEQKDPQAVEVVKSFPFYEHAVKILGEERVHIQRLPYDPKDRNTLMYDDHFWRYHIQEEHILYIQADAVLCPEPEKELSYFLNFSYIGAPWEPDARWVKEWSTLWFRIYQGNGGLSIRSRRAMILTSTFYRNEDNFEWAEDGFYSQNVYRAQLSGMSFIKYPTYEDSQRFSIESQGEIAGLTTAKGKRRTYRPLGFHDPCGKLSVKNGVQAAVHNARVLLKYCPQIAHTLVTDGHEGAVCYGDRDFKNRKEAEKVYDELFGGLPEKELVYRGLKGVKRVSEHYEKRKKERVDM